MYDKMTIFIPIDITENTAELVAWKCLESSGLGGTDSEALHGWILKFREDIKILRISVESFVYWLANGRPPWGAYCEFMSGRLITLNK